MKPGGQNPGGTYDLRPFPRDRDATIELVTLGKRKNCVPLMIEVDVTAAREILRRRKGATGEGLSFTGWAAKCVAQAVSEHKQVQAMRYGRKGLVIFDDVDINIAIERPIVGSPDGGTMPMILVVRRANEKSLEQIHAEVRAAQSRPMEPGEQIMSFDGSAPRFLLPATSSSVFLKPWMTRMLLMIPYTLRRLIVWDRVLRNPFFAKELMGTVFFTSVGMFGRIGSGGSWSIPAYTTPISVSLGGIARRPALVNGQLVEREHLSVTLVIDHDVIDGGPATRFAIRLVELMEGAYGLMPACEPGIKVQVA